MTSEPCPNGCKAHLNASGECPICGAEAVDALWAEHDVMDALDEPQDAVESAWEELRAAKARLAERRREEAERE